MVVIVRTHCSGKKQVILEISVLQGELGCWNYLVLEELIKFPRLRIHAAIETRDHSSVC
jgi:hypothetical protein